MFGVPKGNVHVIWGTAERFKYNGYLEATSEKLISMIKDSHKEDILFVPYSSLQLFSTNSPEGIFFGEKWKNHGDTIVRDGGAGTYHAACKSEYSNPYGLKGKFIPVAPSPEFTDFLVWHYNKYLRKYNIDGLYLDGGSALPSINKDMGCGYIRNGVMRATYPFFAFRELTKRTYTMLKEYGKEKGKDTFMIMHMSSNLIIPILSFNDAYLDGEQFYPGRVPLKDNYLDVMSLDFIRAEAMGQNYGIMPYFLPEITSDINAKDRTKATYQLTGLSILHNFELYAGSATSDMDEINKMYKVLDEFDIVDAKFIGYWKNQEFIKGQTDEIKCSLYRKAKGGALLCILNLTREAKSPTLTVEWDKLKSGAEVAVVDANSKKVQLVSGKQITINLAPLSYKLLWIK